MKIFSLSRSLLLCKGGPSRPFPTKTNLRKSIVNIEISTGNVRSLGNAKCSIGSTYWESESKYWQIYVSISKAEMSIGTKDHAILNPTLASLKFVLEIHKIWEAEIKGWQYQN